MSDLKAAFKETWNDFIDYYEARYDVYSKARKEEGVKEKHIEENYHVIWNEHDMCALLLYFFLKRLEKNHCDIAIHTQFQIQTTKFDELPHFREIWREAVREIRQRKKLKRGAVAGDIDMIFSEKEKAPFQLCVELKFYHYSIEETAKNQERRYHHRRRISTVTSDIKDALSTLEVLKNKKVADDVLLAVFDAYYHETKSKALSNKIKQLIKPYQMQDLVLYYEG